MIATIAHFEAPLQSPAQVAPRDLDIAILRQLTPSKLPLGDALKPCPLQVVGFDAPFRCRPLRQQALEYAPSHPDHALVLADLDPELYSLSLGIPADVLGKCEEHARL